MSSEINAVSICSTDGNVRALGAPMNPGLLFSPLGWLAGDILRALQHKPSLLRSIAEMTSARMHLVALACSVRDDRSDDFIEQCLTMPTAKVLGFSLGGRPMGVRSVLGRLDHNVLQPEAYRALAELCNNAKFGKLLSHVGYLSENCIVALRELPECIRPAALMCRPNLIPGLGAGLKLLSDKAGYKSFEIFATRLFVLRKTNQLCAEIRSIIDALPLPAALPSETIASARRIDCPRRLRALAREMQNCIADLIPDIESGQATIYLVEGSDPIVIRLQRYGRLGWFVEDVKGRGNGPPCQQHCIKLKSAFTEMGLLPALAAKALEQLIDGAGRQGFRPVSTLHARS